MPTETPDWVPAGAQAIWCGLKGAHACAGMLIQAEFALLAFSCRSVALAHHRQIIRSSSSSSRQVVELQHGAARPPCHASLAGGTTLRAARWIAISGALTLGWGSGAGATTSCRWGCVADVVAGCNVTVAADAACAKCLLGGNLATAKCCVAGAARLDVAAARLGSWMQAASGAGPGPIASLHYTPCRRTQTMWPMCGWQAATCTSLPSEWVIPQGGVLGKGFAAPCQRQQQGGQLETSTEPSWWVG